MLLANLVRELDKKFLVNSIPADKPFSIVLPQIYGTKNYDWKKYFEKFFLKNFHGLMLRNGERVDLVVGTVFLDEGVLRKIIKKKAKNIMIFSHHPMGDETAGRGFLPLSEDILKVLQKKNISVYFLKYWLRSKIFQDIIFEYSGGAAIPNVPSAKILKDILIPLPSLEEQNQVVVNIKLMFAETQKLEAIYQQKIDDLDELKKSLLHQAFTGELSKVAA